MDPVIDKERERHANDRSTTGCLSSSAPSSPFLLSPSCGAYLLADASAERGHWNMQARNWDRAAADFVRAWEKGNHPIDLLYWAESLLQQRNSRAGVEEQIAVTLDLRYFEGSDELRYQGALLRWLATHHEVDAAAVLQSYSVVPVGSSMIVDDNRRLADLVCAKPDHAECRVYGILIQPKQFSAEEELRRLLFKDDEHRD